MNSSPVKYVLDGGPLLYRIQWEIGQTYNTIYQKYVSYVMKRYKKPIVIFDSYDRGPTPSPNDVEQLQWPEMLKFPPVCISE